MRKIQFLAYSFLKHFSHFQMYTSIRPLTSIDYTLNKAAEQGTFNHAVIIIMKSSFFAQFGIYIVCLYHLLCQQTLSFFIFSLRPSFASHPYLSQHVLSLSLCRWGGWLAGCYRNSYLKENIRHYLFFLPTASHSFCSTDFISLPPSLSDSLSLSLLYCFHTEFSALICD